MKKIKQKIEKAIQAIDEVLKYNKSDHPAMSNSMHLSRLFNDLKDSLTGNFSDNSKKVDELLNFNSEAGKEPLVLGEGFALGINDLEGNVFNHAPDDMVKTANQAVYDVMFDLTYWRRSEIRPFQPKTAHEIDLEVKGLELLGLLTDKEALASARTLIALNNKQDVYDNGDHPFYVGGFDNQE